MAGPLENSDGSAEWTTERGSRLIASVNGPVEVRLRDELPQKATLELVFRPNNTLPTIREALITDRMHPPLNSIIIRDAYPRSLVQIVVQLLESSGSFSDELVGGINVTSLALAMSASVPLSGLLVAVYIAIEDEELVQKVGFGKTPTSEHAVAFRMTSSGDVPAAPELVLCDSTGKFSETELLAVIAEAERLAPEIYLNIRSRLSEEVTKSLSVLR